MRRYSSYREEFLAQMALGNSVSFRLGAGRASS
jgi:hypothetical protein